MLQQIHVFRSQDHIVVDRVYHVRAFRNWIIYLGRTLERSFNIVRLTLFYCTYIPDSSMEYQVETKSFALQFECSSGDIIAKAFCQHLVDSDL